MRLRNLAATLASAVLIAAPLALAGAAPASADEVWFQSIGRASADAKCAPSTAEDLAAGWTDWAPSWAEWANNGKGGWTCDRQVTWALSGGWAAICGYYMNESVMFNDGWSLPIGTPVYSGSNCETPAGYGTAVNVVYADLGDSALAHARCLEAFNMNNATILSGSNNGVWYCTA